MLKLEANEKCAIFLNHSALINQAFRESSTKNGDVYELRRELFHFEPRKTQPEADCDLSESTTPGKTRAGKRRASKISCAPVEIPINLQDYLSQLTECKVFPVYNPNKNDDSAEQLPHFWSEINHVATLPIFHGANDTGQFHKHYFENIAYLIPPRCRFYNCNILEMEKRLLSDVTEAKTYDLIVIDPPWRNKYIRRLKRIREELAYPMLSTDELRDHLPIRRLAHSTTLVAIWCTNSQLHQNAILKEILPAWHLEHFHTIKWFKLNTERQLISPLRSDGQKQPYEILFLARHKDSAKDFNATLKNVDCILSVPSVIHSHKPPLLEWLRGHLPVDSPNCLEIFARYLQPYFTSVGLEVLKLMDERLYTKSNAHY